MYWSCRKEQWFWNIKCSVSLDESWQQQYGFLSLLLIGYLISIETEEVLYYGVKSKLWFGCKARIDLEINFRDVRTGIKSTNMNLLWIILNYQDRKNGKTSCSDHVFTFNRKSQCLFHYLCWRWQFFFFGWSHKYGENYTVTKKIVRNIFKGELWLTWDH